MKLIKKNKLLMITLVLINLLLFFNVFPYLVDIFKFVIKLLIPFIIGFTFAFILLPIVNFLVKYKFKREFAVMIVVSIFIGLIGLLGYLLFPVIIEEVYKIIQKTPDYARFIEDKIYFLQEKLDFLPIKILPSDGNIEEIVVNYLMKLLNTCFSVIKNSMNYIINLLLSIILMIYFLIDFDKIINWLKEVSSKFKRIDLQGFLIDIKNTMQAYFKGVILTTIILIVLSFILFTIFKIDYAFLLACLIGITDIIPYIGPYIGGSFVFLVALSISIKKAIIVLIIIIILQGLESWFITPKIQSRSIKVHPIIVLFSLIFFGKILGIMGMIVAVPIVAIIQTAIRRYLLT